MREWQTTPVFLPIEPHELYKQAKKNDTERRDWLKLKGVQYATEEGRRNSSKKNEEAELKQKQCPVVAVTGDGSKVEVL